MNDREFYSAMYSAKEQPHMEAFLNSVLDGVRHLPPIKRGGSGSDSRADQADMARERALLHRSLATLNKRMYKGFPEIYSYLLRKPLFYSSYEFLPAGIIRFVAVATELLLNCASV